MDISRDLTVGGPLNVVLCSNGIYKVLYVLKTFYRFLMYRGSFRGHLWTEDILRDIYGEKIFERTTMDKGPYKGLIMSYVNMVKDLLSVLYRKRVFLWYSIMGRSFKGSLWSVDFERSPIAKGYFKGSL